MNGIGHLVDKQDGSACINSNKRKRCKFKTATIPKIETEKMIVKMWRESNYKNKGHNGEAKMQDELMDSALNER